MKKKVFIALVVVIALCLCLSVSAFAEEGREGDFGGRGGFGSSGAEGMAAVSSSVETVIIPMLNQVIALMTSNPLFAAFLGVGLVGIGVVVFRRIKRAARG